MKYVQRRPYRDRIRSPLHTGIPILNRNWLLAKGLFGLWHLDGNPSRVIDISGNGFDMTRPGTVAVTPVSEPNFGFGADFNNTIEERFEVDIDEGLLTDFPITFGAWASAPTLDANKAILSFGDSASPTNNFIGTDARGTGRLRVDWNSVNQDDFASTIFDVTIPHLFVVRIVSATQRDYFVDGIFRTTFTTSATFPTINRMGLGAIVDSTPGLPWTGGIFNGFVWRRALTDAEMWFLFNRVTRWDFYSEPKLMVSIPVEAAAPAEVLGHGKLFSRERNRLVDHL